MLYVYKMENEQDTIDIAESITFLGEVPKFSSCKCSNSFNWLVQSSWLKAEQQQGLITLFTGDKQPIVKHLIS